MPGGRGLLRPGEPERQRAQDELEQLEFAIRHDLCDEPAENCQIDHVEPWSAGGATVAANGRAACGHHNRRRHRRP